MQMRKIELIDKIYWTPGIVIRVESSHEHDRRGPCLLEAYSPMRKTSSEQVALSVAISLEGSLLWECAAEI